MNKHLTNKMMETDIRKAKANIYDHRAIDKLKENLGGAWKPKDFNQSNEDHHLLNLANYLIEVSTLAEITTMLRKAIDARGFSLKFLDIR